MSSNAGKPQIPSDMKAFNLKVIDEFRATRGQLSGQMAGRQILLLTTIGARSGAERTTVIGYRPRGREFAVIASNNGADKAPAWYHNLLANPIATIEVGPERFQVKARVVGQDERAKLTEIIDYLERQQALTPRQIPILVLERL